MIPAALCWIGGSLSLLVGLAAAASAGEEAGRVGLEKLPSRRVRIAFVATILGAILWRLA